MIVLVILGVLAVLCIAGIGIVVALVVPAISMARSAAFQSANGNNLKMIGVAMHNYHDTFQTLPPASIADAGGQPRTSWRAMLLPFLGSPYAAHYNFNVGWDSLENEQLRALQVREYHDVQHARMGATNTTFVAIAGPGTAFAGPNGASFANLRDGTSTTILLVQIKNSDIGWSEPRDLDINFLTDDPQAPNCIDLKGGTLALMADGAVVRLPRDMTLQTLKDYITIADGKALPPLN
jgi:hypothetical protein